MAAIAKGKPFWSLLWSQALEMLNASCYRDGERDRSCPMLRLEGGARQSSLDTSERSHNLLPFCSELGGLFVWWGLCAAFSSAGVK